MRPRIIQMAVLFCLLFFTGKVLAGPKALPDFELKSANGQAVRSVSLARDGKWLLVYIEPGCQPCDTVLRVFRRETRDAQPLQNVIVVVAGREPQEIRALASGFPWIDANSWFADPTRQLASVLKTKGAPVTFGLEGGNISWALEGTLSDQKNLKAILIGWCGCTESRGSAATNKTRQ